MLEVKIIKENSENVIKSLEKRGIESARLTVENLIKLDDLRKSTQVINDDLANKINNLSEQIGDLFKNGKASEANNLKDQVSTLKDEATTVVRSLTDYEDKLRDKLYSLPNIPHRSVPKGLKDEDDQIMYQSEIPEYPDNIIPHWELTKKYDIIDFELGNKITGAGFPVYKKKGARLQRALINFFLDSAIKAGYEEVQVPNIVNEESAFGTGQLPDKEGMMYKLADEKYYLIPTAEVPIVNLYRDTILSEKELPIKHVGYTSCFRREAGSWGSHVRGLNRLHQFDKVEIIQIQKPDNSYDTLEEISLYVENLIKKLELPYRKLKLCVGNLGFTAALTYDLEVYSAGQKRWLEVSSISNVESFQSNRMKLRCKDAKNKKYLPHTLNGSAIALPRIMASILENNQFDNGIKIPEVLIPYTGFEMIN